MPHTPSAKKNLRKSEKRRARNRSTVRAIRTHLKRFETAEAGPADQLQEEYNLAAKKLDKAAARGVIHRNLAARKKAQMAKALRAKKAAPAAPPA